MVVRMHMYDGATRCLGPHTHNRAASHVCIAGLHAFVGGQRRPTNERMKSIIIFHHSFSYRFRFIHRKIYRLRWRHALRAREQARRRRAPSSTPKYSVLCAFLGELRYFCERAIEYFHIFFWHLPLLCEVFAGATRTLRGFRLQTRTHRIFFSYFPIFLSFVSSLTLFISSNKKKRIYAVDDKSMSK